MISPSARTRCLQRHVRARPHTAEARFRYDRFSVLPLRPEHLHEPEQGPAVLGEAPEVLAIRFLGLGIVSRLLRIFPRFVTNTTRSLTSTSGHLRDHVSSS